METLDVTKIEPRLKHPTIFQRFDALDEGAALVISNDHDPKPLYYQLLAERGQTFQWEYLKQGPDIWEVKITKLKKESSATIGELAAEDYRKAEVFKKFGMDFCCGGHKTLKEACEEKGVKLSEVEEVLKKVEEQPKLASQDFNNWELDFLADYIVNTHHRYVKESMPLIKELSAKVSSVHGQHHPELFEIGKHFSAIAEEMTMHMHKEENILFPYIKQLAIAKREDRSISSPPFGSVENPIRIMEMEHDSTAEKLEKIYTLSNAYTIPQDACSSYNLLYKKLEEFENDLKQHIHLENNILFPKSIQIEKELFTQ